MMLAGGDFMYDLDVQRADAAGAELRAVPAIPSPPTFIALAKRLMSGPSPPWRRRMGASSGAGSPRWLSSAMRRWLGCARRWILDLTDEVYGRHKEGFAYNHKGQMVGRPHPVAWAEAGVVLSAELGDGRCDPRPQAPGLIRRAVAVLPEGPVSRVEDLVRRHCGRLEAAKAAALVSQAVPQAALRTGLPLEDEDVVAATRSARVAASALVAGPRAGPEAGCVIGRLGPMFDGSAPPATA